ncbi:DUF6212 domain-containing protein [Chthonobacter rhizosphaerae]|uniref:DUF6212 domain-containing protein n=1 Tax=Chthonobacter rhizosphaerae TaxID=2735553 RepID=UPI0015EFD61A|nr:DUF6212 domain-containing protein [Chthonobacter rhizosphaerae]
MAQAAQRFELNPEYLSGLLSEPVVIAVGLDRDALGDELIHAATVVWFDGVRDGAATFTDARNVVSTLVEAPLYTAAILVQERGSLAEKRLLRWLEDRGVTARVPVLEWCLERRADGIARVLKEITKLVTVSARGRVQAFRELSALRQMNEDLQNRFAALEGFLQRRGLQPHDLVFSNDPVIDPSHPNLMAEFAADGIAQILPVASNGVSAIGIHFDQPPVDMDARLLVQLVSLEDQRILDRWIVPANEIATGWTILGLRRALAGVRRTLELRLKLQGDEQSMPGLSLGGLQPLEMFRIRNAATGGAILKNSLALQVWCGLPGVSLPGWATVIPAVTPETLRDGFRDVPVAPGIVDLIELANPDEVSFDFAAVAPIPQERAVQCHPPAVGMTIGRLPAVCPPSVIRVSGTATVANEKARPVEFAIVVAGDAAKARALLAGTRLPAPGEAFSGWVRCASDEERRVSAFMTDQIDAWQNIFVATRMLEPGDNSFAWARMSDISLMVNE